MNAARFPSPGAHAAALVAAAVLVVGCAPMPLHEDKSTPSYRVRLDPQPVQTCADDGKPCDVTVTVTYENGVCKVGLPEEVRVFGRGVDRRMTWTLDPGVSINEFRLLGIKIPLDPDQQVFARRSVVQGRQLDLFNRTPPASFGVAYGYTLLIVVKPAGAAVFRGCGADPVIVNMG